MATGDDAVAAGMDILTGNELANTLDTEENKTRDYIAQRTDKPGTPRPVAKGGTGATDAAGARTNLDVPSNAKAVLSKNDTNHIEFDWNSSTATLRLTAYVDGINVGALAYTTDIPAGGGYLPLSGGIVTGSLYLPNATPAASGYTVAYLNNDGRISKGASSERYKDNIVETDPAALGDIFPTLHSYTHKEDETHHTRYGWIAERLAEHPDQETFVVYDLDGRPDSIDFIGLLIAQNAQLNQETTDLRSVVAALNDRIASLEDAS